MESLCPSTGPRLGPNSRLGNDGNAKGPMPVRCLQAVDAKLGHEAGPAEAGVSPAVNAPMQVRLSVACMSAACRQLASLSVRIELGIV